jgi:hypothetical protein
MLAGLVVDTNDLETLVNRDRGRRGMRVLNMKNGMEEDGTQAAMGLDLFNERHETVPVTAVEEGRLAIVQAHPPIGSWSKNWPITRPPIANDALGLGGRISNGCSPPSGKGNGLNNSACVSTPRLYEVPCFFPLVLGSAPATQTEECHMLHTFGIDRYYGMGFFASDLDRGMVFHMSLSAEFLAKKLHPC